MKWIEKYLESNYFKEFQSVVDGISKDGDYQSWLGINFDGSSLYSVKFYYTWFRILTESEVKKLLFFGSTDDFYKEYEKVALNNILNTKEFGGGFTFTLKLDTKLRPTYGFYFKQFFDEHDPFFSLPETKEFLATNDASEINFVKHHGVFYHPDGSKNDKSYYYVGNQEFKEIIAKMFGDPAIATSPMIEYAVGSGHRKPSSDALSNKKVVLMGDSGSIAAHYINEWKDISSYSKSMLDEGFYVPSPGIYGDQKARSLYAFDRSRQIVEALVERFSRNNQSAKS